ncbi:MAG: hypothetical protein K9L66_13020 [Spirochaetaceae bacterium]|nr:hypothetical protein [Spirochaetaceae bacterium]
MSNDLNEHTYIVVGGSSGIGQALVLELLERNATVHVWSRSTCPNSEITKNRPGTETLALTF